MRRHQDFSYQSDRKQANTEGLPLFDICRNKHKGSPESKNSNEKVSPHKNHLRRIVYDAISASGSTSHELVAITGIPLQTISARLSELKAMLEVIPTGERRNGAAVLRRAA